MCGIIGYCGPLDAQTVLLNGLTQLEYRGYDSAGIALFDENSKIHFIKKVGKVAGVSLLAFEVYASYIKSVARSFYSQLLLLWIPMRTKFPLCFLSAFFLILFLFPFIQILSTFLV